MSKPVEQNVYTVYVPESNHGLSHKKKKTLARELAGPGESPFASRQWVERKAKIADRVQKKEAIAQQKAAERRAKKEAANA